MAIFFVGGSQRSGTTLLQTILCQDESVNPLIQEAKYLRHLVKAYSFGKQQFKAETRDYFRDYRQFLAFNERIVRSFLKNTRALFPDAKHLALREPHLTLLFPDLAELLPGAKFLCVVRDPRDAVASMIEVGRNLREKTGGRDPMAQIFNSGDVTAIGRHYLSFYRPVLEAKQADFRRRLLMVRYEDLVTETQAAIQTLREFTGIALADFDPSQDPNTGRVDYHKLDEYRKAWATESYTKKITDSRIGRYAEVLNEAQIQELNDNFSGFMKRFGYT